MACCNQSGGNSPSLLGLLAASITAIPPPYSADRRKAHAVEHHREARGSDRRCQSPTQKRRRARRRHLHGRRHRRADHRDGRQRPDRGRFRQRLDAPAGYLVATIVLGLFASATRRWPSTSPPPARSTATSPTASAASSAWPPACSTWRTSSSRRSLIGIFAFFAATSFVSPGRRRHPLAGVRAADAGAQRDPDLLRDQPGRQGPGRVPGDRDRHAVARWRSPCSPRRRARGLPRRPDAQPGRRVPARRRSPAQRRPRPVLRVLVLGRLRVDRDVRRGVPRPQEDHPAGDDDRVLGVGIFYVFVSWMAIAGTGPRRPSSWPQRARTARRSSSAPSAAPSGHWAVDAVQVPADDGLVRLRRWRSTTAPRATCTRSAARTWSPACQRTIGRHPPQARLAPHRRVRADRDPP